MSKIDIEDAWAFVKTLDQGKAIIKDLEDKVKLATQSMYGLPDNELRQVTGLVNAYLGLLDEIAEAELKREEDA